MGVRAGKERVDGEGREDVAVKWGCGRRGIRLTYDRKHLTEKD